MTPDVDLVVIARDQQALTPEVERGIASQSGVHLTVHRVVGQQQPDDSNRWATIARARNRGKLLGRAPWLMFLDDDVSLAPGTVRTLVDTLSASPLYGAVAADYLSEGDAAGRSKHVAMGATLFRRSALSAFRFRWELAKCECQCCCDDLRRQGLGIKYVPQAAARHLSKRGFHHAPALGSSTVTHTGPSPRILAAFNRRHFRKFASRFLPSLRQTKNFEMVTAVTYGLYPSERQLLARMPGVEVVGLPRSKLSPAIGRLREFQDVLSRWPADTPVAYWDAGDVLFQSKLDPLWSRVREHPDRLLVVREPFGHPENGAVKEWTLTIRDQATRSMAFALLSRNPFLNAGMVAASAATLMRYLRFAYPFRISSLRGTSDWGDQTALNIYCYSEPDRHVEVEADWNYCLFSRPRTKYRIQANGTITDGDGRLIPVVHGNASTLEHYWFKQSLRREKQIWRGSSLTASAQI